MSSKHNEVIAVSRPQSKRRLEPSDDLARGTEQPSNREYVGGEAPSPTTSAYDCDAKFAACRKRPNRRDAS